MGKSIEAELKERKVVQDENREIVHTIVDSSDVVLAIGITNKESEGSNVQVSFVCSDDDKLILLDTCIEVLKEIKKDETLRLVASQTSQEKAN